MPKQEMGLMGYIGEQVIEQWIRSKYPSKKYEVVKQIMPVGIPRAGGPYLDFGVVKKSSKFVEKIYEVKSQNFIFSGPINKALRYIWKHQRRIPQYETQEGNKYQGSHRLEAFLILLVGPNKYGKKAIGEKNLRRVILFQDIWKNSSQWFDFNSLMKNFKTHAKEVKKILQNPGTGKKINQNFLQIRNEP